jgi:hypothetical protein
MTTYHVEATRQGRWWALQCLELPSAFSQVTRLDKAAETIREAIAFVAQVAADSFEIEIIPKVPDSYTSEVRAAEQARALASSANRQAADHSRAAARALAKAGFTLRDIGVVMGISHQRAAQLVA